MNEHFIAKESLSGDPSTCDRILIQARKNLYLAVVIDYVVLLPWSEFHNNEKIVEIYSERRSPGGTKS